MDTEAAELLDELLADLETATLRIEALLAGPYEGRERLTAEDVAGIAYRLAALGEAASLLIRDWGANGPTH